MRTSNSILLLQLALVAVSTNAEISEIYNGSEMEPGSRPYLVSIGFNIDGFPFGFHNCGGSLISSRAVMTAAHCVFSSAPNWIDFERHDLDEPPPRRRSFFANADNLIVHPKYDPMTSAYDVAVMILTPGDAIRDITPILLNNNPFIPKENDPLDLAGWGDTNGTSPQNLPTHITVAYTTKDTAQGTCDREPYDLCTIDITGDGQMPCSGDSGGPLVLGKGEPDLGPVLPAVQVGIVSRGFACPANAPDVYTRVTAVSAWVKATVCAKAGELCSPTRKPTAKPSLAGGKGGKKPSDSKGSKDS